MNVIIPPKRRDKKTSFRKLVDYVTTRDEKKDEEVVSDTHQTSRPDANHELTSNGFDRLISYVGRESSASVNQIISISPEGVQRVLSGEVLCETNCFSLETAASEMNMTAMQNRHCKDAVYHFILSWQQDEEPSPDSIFGSVRYSLDSLGMKDNQYVAAIHRDTDNIHCHVSVNRVHPETFRAQNMWNDADNLQKSCRILERHYGFKVDNGSWHLDNNYELHRTPRSMPSAPRGAMKREIFADAESLHGYAVRETRDTLSKVISDDKLDWELLHSVLHSSGLGVREQNGGLAVYNIFDPEGVCVKASDVHPGISLPNMEKRSGTFTEAPAAFDPDRLENGITSIESSYSPMLHRRDIGLRQERREARAVAREILRARYDAYRSGWEKPDLRARARFQQISSNCVVVKSHVRQSVRDPLLRKLMYRVAEFEKMKAMAELRLKLREERVELAITGANKPLSWKRWVEQEALRGDVAAISQLRGWSYREKRKVRQHERSVVEPNAVISFGSNDDAPVFRSNEHETRLLRDGTVNYLRNGQPAVTDFGGRVEVYPSNDMASDRFNNDLAAELTAWRSGDNAVVQGEQTAVNRVLYSGAIRNINSDNDHYFKVSDSKQQANVTATEMHYRQQGDVQERKDVNQQLRDAEDIRVSKDIPRP